MDEILNMILNNMDDDSLMDIRDTASTVSAHILKGIISGKPIDQDSIDNLKASVIDILHEQAISDSIDSVILEHLQGYDDESLFWSMLADQVIIAVV
jgi:hypothetical protein